jgi:hypothetical protein
MHRTLILAILATALAAAETVIDPCTEPTGWAFSKGDEFAGAAGSLTAASAGGLRLAWDFSAGGSYLSAQPKAALPAGTVAVVASLATDKPCTIAWRMRDANGRTFQSDYIALPAGTTRVVRTATGPWGGSWGGKADTGPAPGMAVAFALLVDKRNGTPASGSLTITSFAALDAVPR